MEKQNKCPYCKSKDLSDGENDFVIADGKEKLIQFCDECHDEWEIN